MTTVKGGAGESLLTGVSRYRASVSFGCNQYGRRDRSSVQHQAVSEDSCRAVLGVAERVRVCIVELYNSTVYRQWRAENFIAAATEPPCSPCHVTIYSVLILCKNLSFFHFGTFQNFSCRQAPELPPSSALTDLFSSWYEEQNLCYFQPWLGCVLQANR